MLEKLYGEILKMSSPDKSEILGEFERNLIFKTFIEIGPKISGNSIPFAPPSTIKWLDPLLLNEGMRFVQEHYFAVTVSSFLGGWFSFGGRNLGIESTFRNGHNSDPKKSFIRIISTMIRFIPMYETDLGDDNSKGVKYG